MTGEFLHGLQANLLSPPVLFFALGLMAAVARSDLKFPGALYVSLTIYLLCAIGFKGGVAMAKAGLSKVWLPTLAAMTLGALIPLWVYPVLRLAGKLPAVDAAAIAGHYGSVSAVTFIAATNFLKELALPYEGYATAFLAAMEAPSIIVGIVLGKMALRRQGAATGGGFGPVLHEALLGRIVFLSVVAQRLDLPCIDGAGAPPDLTRETGWVAAATVGAVSDAMLRAADTTVWLHYSPLSVLQAWGRRLRKHHAGPTGAGKSPGLADVRDSILHMAWTPHLHRLLRHPALLHLQVFHLRNPDETDFWLRAQEHRLLPRRVPAAPPA